ncbi:MAG TPA: glycosyltransferase family 4 protein [Xanthobacteraceae bacterium]|nr:glycosyltransferase family 4 protein [Xanthobacteraceae bacterium]
MGDLRPLNSKFGLETFAPAAAAAHAPASPAQHAAYAPTSLKILHLLRAPLGGLFRHVVDVTRGQVERGHRVGLIVDSTTGGANAEATLAALAPRLALGILRVPITREINPRDFGALWTISRRITTLKPDVLHGHGAKGAALARLTPAAPDAIRVYTPHGGSLVYSPGTVKGGFYRSLERILNGRTDLFLFESTYIADLFRSVIAKPRGLVRVVRNGIAESEFEPVTPRPDATDIVCVGELRPVKAIDVLIEAIAIMARSGRKVTATIAGEGPDSQKLHDQAKRHGIDGQIRFIGHCPARKAFAMGRMLVMPSRAESLPYVALEAAAAGMPIIATDVGGVHEIFGPHSGHLIPADDVGALIAEVTEALTKPEDIRQLAESLRIRVRSEFSLSTMVECNLAAYREAIASRDAALSA